MTGLKALQSVQYKTIKGERFAVVPLEDWEVLLEWLETVEDVEVAGVAFAELKRANGEPQKVGWLKWEEVNASDASLRPENRRALEFLRNWMMEEDNLGDDWWSTLEQELKANRFSVGKD